MIHNQALLLQWQNDIAEESCELNDELKQKLMHLYEIEFRMRWA